MMLERAGAAAANFDIASEADRAYEIVRDGGLALVPAAIGYSFTGRSARSIRLMYELKGRSYANPSIVPATLEIVAATARLRDPALLDWLAEVSENSTLAVVLPVREDSRLLLGLDAWVRARATSDGSMAFYLNTGDFPDRMVRRGIEDGLLLVGSSGNLSGHGNNYRYEDVPESIRAAVHYSVDCGPSPFANAERFATTIVNCCDFTIRRKGVCYDEIIASYERFARSRAALPKSLSASG